ncbi:unnamed protein product, partial [Rotaria sp. Silwood2]
LDITRNINVVPIVWQDVWDEKVELPSGTIIQVWKDTSDNSAFGSWASYLNEAANEGYNVILSSPWYINYISYGKYNTNTSVMNLEFFKYYEVEPLRLFSGSDEAKKRILGGEACLWGEFVDGTNLLPRFWPKASAVAERLWSAASVNNSEDAQFRLDVHRCRLLRRGIPAQPILGGYCGNYELGMPESMINDPAFNYENYTPTNSTTTSTQSSTNSSSERSPPNAVWPHPQQIVASNESLYIRPHDIMIHSNIRTCDIISKAIERYEPIFFPPKLSMSEPPSDADNILQNLTLNIRDNPQCEQYIQQNSNETYTLTINNKIAIVEASSVWGLLRGLETFSQLIYINEQNYVVINNSVTVIDSPRFQHRGVMLDSARHFLPVPIIKKNLDVMAYNKLNVFHWHLVDDQSFPFQSTTFPNLSRAGAFSTYHVYTPADVNDVIEHARLRGIRVIPEIDTPGHTYSWGKSMPELITPCWANGKPYQAIYGIQGAMEIFNPIEPRVYSTMDALLREVKSRFPSNYIHLVYDKCWLSNPNITQWMIDNSINSTKGIHAYYADRILDITRNINVVPIVWQDVWDEKVE